MSEILIPDWDEVYMTMVYLIASKSKDKHTHTGAVIAGPDNEFKSIGYNSFPRKINDNVSERQSRDNGEKYFWFEHAERNAIFYAGRDGRSLIGCKMYTNGVPCMDCARGVVQSGITEVIVDKAWNADNPEKWRDHARRTIEMFGETGVSIRYWEGNLVKIEKFRRGKIIS